MTADSLTHVVIDDAALWECHEVRRFGPVRLSALVSISLGLLNARDSGMPLRYIGGQHDCRDGRSLAFTEYAFVD